VNHSGGSWIIHEPRPTHPTSNPPHPFIKVEAVAPEDVVNYLEEAATKALWGDRWVRLDRRL